MVVLSGRLAGAVLELDPKEDPDVELLSVSVCRFQEVLLPRISLAVSCLTGQHA